MARADGRAPDQLRPVTLTRNYLAHPEGSVLVEFGATKVICTASVEDKVPPFLKGQGLGWVTAEYAMLPRSTNTRTPRENRGPSGRSQEIQRLVGRALRAVVNRGKLGERTVGIDCDVIQADGGDPHRRHHGRSFVALADAIARMPGVRAVGPLRDCVAAISVGIVKGAPALDLNYSEDSVGRGRHERGDDRSGRLRGGAGDRRAGAVRARSPRSSSSVSRKAASASSSRSSGGPSPRAPNKASRCTAAPPTE